MGFVLLAVCVIVQIGLGSYILFQDVKSWPHRVFSLFMLVNGLNSMHALFRFVVTDQGIAAVFVATDVIITFIWNATCIVLAVIAVFYQNWISTQKFWTLYVPLGVALIGTLVVWGAFLNVQEKTDIVLLPSGANVYMGNSAEFPAQTWALAYDGICILVSIGLLINAIVRRSDTHWRAAIWMLIIIVLVGAINFVAPRTVPRYSPLILSLSGASFSLFYGFIIVRYRLFSARDVAIELAFDRLANGVIILQSDLVVAGCNQSAAGLLGVSKPFLINRSVEAVLRFSPFPAKEWHDLLRKLRDEPSATLEVEYRLGQKARTIINELMAVADNEGTVRGYVWILDDVTGQRQSEREIGQRNAELENAMRELRATNEAQGELLETIRTLSAPAVPVLQGVVVLPLSGQINSDRAMLIMGNLLAGIREYEAKVAIIDITGVPHVDTSVADYLIQAARAGALMGCRSILVGIRPEIAQVIVELGIDMAGLRTFSDLRSGVEYALRMLGMELKHVLL